jgi:hypothetical protein
MIVSGLLVFGNLKDAINAGYQVYERTGNGYLVRTRTNAGWALAIVHLELYSSI